MTHFDIHVRGSPLKGSINPMPKLSWLKVLIPFACPEKLMYRSTFRNSCSCWFGCDVNSVPSVLRHFSLVRKSYPSVFGDTHTLLFLSIFDASSASMLFALTSTPYHLTVFFHWSGVRPIRHPLRPFLSEWFVSPNKFSNSPSIHYIYSWIP